MDPALFKLIYTDDDAEDREFFAEGVRNINVPVELSVFESGMALLSHLADAGHEERLPYSIVCDMKMHMLDGLDVLKLIKANPKWEKIPFFILSTSSSNHDRERVIQSGAMAFYTKPSSLNELQFIIGEIIQLTSSFRKDSGTTN